MEGFYFDCAKDHSMNGSPLTKIVIYRQKKGKNQAMSTLEEKGNEERKHRIQFL